MARKARLPLRSRGATALLALGMSIAAATQPAADPARVTLVRALPVDSGRVDVAAHVLPIPGGALISGWTTAPGSPPDGLLLRVNQAGDVIWRRHHGAENTDLTFAVQPDGAGGFVCAGFVAGRGAGGSDGWIYAVDSSGAVVWEKTYGGSEDERLTSLARTRDGWIAAGQTSRGGNVDAWVVRVDRGGREIASHILGGSGVERALGVVALEDGGCVMAGVVADSTDPGDAFAIRLDRRGRARWMHHTREPGRQVAYHLRATRDRLIVTGYGWADSARDFDGRVTELDVSGRVLRQVTLGGPAADRAVQSVRLADGTLITIGYSRPRDRPDEGPGWTTMLYQVDPRGRVTWSQPVGDPGRDSGRWIAGEGGDLWAVGQSGTPDGGSAVLLVRLDARGGDRGAPSRRGKQPR